METFIQNTKNPSLQKSIDDIQHDLEKAKVIGVGEESHGETVSWSWRYAIINRLVNLGYKVIVLCEQQDNALQNEDGKRLQELNGDVSQWNFWSNKGVKYFTPNIIPISDKSLWHFNVTRAFSMFPASKVEYYGIDVKTVHLKNYPFYYPSKIVRRIVKKFQKDWMAVQGKGDISENCMRNELQGRIIANMVNEMDKPKTKFMYIAHNYHVAVATKQPILYGVKNQHCLRDGFVIRDLLKRMGHTYLVIGTFTPKLFSFQLLKDHSKPFHDYKFLGLDVDKQEKEYAIYSIPKQNTYFVIDEENEKNDLAIYDYVAITRHAQRVFFLRHLPKGTSYSKHYLPEYDKM